MSKKMYYIGLIGQTVDEQEIIASCPTDHDTLVQMRKDGLSFHRLDCGRLSIGIMHNAETFDPILASMAINAYIHFTDNNIPMYETIDTE